MGIDNVFEKKSRKSIEDIQKENDVLIEKIIKEKEDGYDGLSPEEQYYKDLRDLEERKRDRDWNEYEYNMDRPKIETSLGEAVLQKNGFVFLKDNGDHPLSGLTLERTIETREGDEYNLMLPYSGILFDCRWIDENDIDAIKEHIENTDGMPQVSRDVIEDAILNPEKYNGYKR